MEFLRSLLDCKFPSALSLEGFFLLTSALCLPLKPFGGKGKVISERVSAEGLVGAAGVHGAASQQLFPEGCKVSWGVL